MLPTFSGIYVVEVTVSFSDKTTQAKSYAVHAATVSEAEEIAWSVAKQQRISQCSLVGFRTLEPSQLHPNVMLLI